jgi:hypothetical protein
MAIKLSLPRVAPTPDPTVETRTVYVEEWVESLAYANPPALLDQTLEAIERLNQQPLKPSLRAELLDLHVRPYAYALEFRRTQEPARTGTALARQRAVSRRLRLTAIAMALGYKQALSDLTARKSKFGGAKELRAMLQRSLLFSSLALLHCYDEYRPTLPRLWLEAVALYKFAARSQLHEEPVACPVDEPLFSQSTADCFKRLCLTSLVDPYHLAYGELWTVYRDFGRYAAQAAIGEVEEVKRLAGRFVIDPTVDRRPAPLAQAQRAPASHCRLLDANPVLDTLRERHRNGAAEDDLPSHVLAAMIRALGLPPKRHAPRESTDGRVRVAAGLSTVHHFLGGGGESAACGRGGDDSDIEIGDVAGPASEHGMSYRHEAWELVNEGPGGVGMLTRARPDNPVGVGELIGMQFPLRGDAEDEWSLGVVRWLNIGSDEEYQAGVQLLGEAVTPAMAYFESVTDTITRIPRPTLALPGLGTDPSYTLITPRGMFASGNRLRINTRTETCLVEAIAASESTATFDRFTYRIIDDA